MNSSQLRCCVYPQVVLLLLLVVLSFLWQIHAQMWLGICQIRDPKCESSRRKICVWAFYSTFGCPTEYSYSLRWYNLRRIFVRLDEIGLRIWIPLSVVYWIPRNHLKVLGPNWTLVGKCIECKYGIDCKSRAELLSSCHGNFHKNPLGMNEWLVLHNDRKGRADGAGRVSERAVNAAISLPLQHSRRLSLRIQRT